MPSTIWDYLESALRLAIKGALAYLVVCLLVMGLVFCHEGTLSAQDDLSIPDGLTPFERALNATGAARPSLSRSSSVPSELELEITDDCQVKLEAIDERGPHQQLKQAVEAIGPSRNHPLYFWWNCDAPHGVRRCPTDWWVQCGFELGHPCPMRWEVFAKSPAGSHERVRGGPGMPWYRPRVLGEHEFNWRLIRVAPEVLADPHWLGGGYFGKPWAGKTLAGSRYWFSPGCVYGGFADDFETGTTGRWNR